MLLYPSLNDLSDVLERGSILVHHVVAEGYAVARVSPVPHHLEDSIEVSAGLVISTFLE